MWVSLEIDTFKGANKILSTFLRYLTQIMQFIMYPTLACAIASEHKVHKQHFTVSKQRAHSGYEKSTFVWRESIGEPK